MIKAIVFDFDGTLVDSLPIVVKAVNVLAKKYGHAEIKNVSKLRNKSLRIIIRQDFHLSMFDVPKYAREVKLLIRKDMKKVRIFPEIKVILKKISKQYQIGILTSNSEETVRSVLKNEHFDFIFSNSSIFGKAIVLKRLLKEHNLNKDEIIYVGDETRDIEACKKIGVKCIAVTWGYNSENILKSFKPDFLARNTKELLNILMPAR
jgi:phosphoglycolate phosphatase